MLSFMVSTEKPTKQEYIGTLMPINPYCDVSPNINETIKRIHHLRAPYILVDSHAVYGHYYYENAVVSLNKLLDVIAPMSLDYVIGACQVHV